MDRNKATRLLRDELDKYGLTDWGIRLSTDANSGFAGKCMGFPDNIIFLNAHHVDIHHESEIIDTIKHEVAHALTPKDTVHGTEWQNKAIELGCNLRPCSPIPPELINAIRSGASIEVTMVDAIEKRVIEEVVQKPKYTVTRLQEKCATCGRVAVEKFKTEMVNKVGDTVIMTTLACFHVKIVTIPRGTAFDSLVSNWWKPEIKECKHVWGKGQNLEKGGDGVRKTECTKCGEFKLYPFQVKAAYFLEGALPVNKGAAGFLDMGLGKTVIALAVVHFHSKEYTPTLYVVKSKVKFQWFKEIIRWLGPDFFPQVINTSKDYVFPKMKSYIISYDLLKAFPKDKIEALGIKLVVLDECQQIKNPDSTRTQEIRKILNNPAIKVIPLSGTPWKNRGSEFFPVLNMMSPTKFGNYEVYKKVWVEYFWKGDKLKEGGIKNPEKFKEYISDIAIRFEYNEVMDEFPEINRMKLNMQLDTLTQETYEGVESSFVNWYNQFVIDGTEDSIDQIQLMAHFNRMRQITGLAKIPATVGFVEEFIETGKPLVIFVQHIEVGQLLFREIDKLCKENNYKAFKFTANLSDEEAFNMAEEFNKTPRAIMVASTIAGGEGVNLQSCCDSILHERQWNPQNEDQATPGRFRRIGQKSPVINITCVHADGTVDEDMDAIVEGKRRGFHIVMNKGQVPQWSESDIIKELAARIVARNKKKNPNKPKTNITAAVASLSTKKNPVQLMIGD